MWCRICNSSNNVCIYMYTRTHVLGGTRYLKVTRDIMYKPPWKSILFFVGHFFFYPSVNIAPRFRVAIFIDRITRIIIVDLYELSISLIYHSFVCRKHFVLTGRRVRWGPLYSLEKTIFKISSGTRYSSK